MSIESEILTAAENLRGLEAVIPPISKKSEIVTPITIHVPPTNQTLKIEYPSWLFLDTLIFAAIGAYFILLGFIIKGVTL